MNAGTSGDVDPLIGIGRVLKSRGHEVLVLSVPIFEGLARKAGLEFVPIGSAETYNATLGDQRLWSKEEAFQVLMAGALRAMQPTLEAVQRLYLPGQTVLCGGPMAMGARLFQAKTGAPYASLTLQPWTFAQGALPQVAAMREQALRPHIETLAAGLGLELPERLFTGWQASPQRVLAMYPEWYAPGVPAPPQTVFCGFPMFDGAGIEPVPPDLEEFLGAGEPPIMFTFGTGMTQAGPLFRACAEACGRLGRRGLILTRHPEQLPADLPAGVALFEYAPFSAVLPRVAALVHHGGIGTTSQALKAGVKQVVIPFAHDQPDNALRVSELGVGTWLPPEKATPEGLVGVLEPTLANEEYAAHAAEVRLRFAENRGLERAADELEALAPV